jgi:myo-inositol-1-phosphate synthase
MVKEDIKKFKEEKKLDRMVMVWCGSTEIYQEMVPGVHDTLANFEKGTQRKNQPAIAPSMIILITQALDMGIPYANGAPNLCNDIPAFGNLLIKTKYRWVVKTLKAADIYEKPSLLRASSQRMHRYDRLVFKQTYLETGIGEVLDDPDSFKSKEVSKLSVLEQNTSAGRVPGSL